MSKLTPLIAVALFAVACDDAEPATPPAADNQPAEAAQNTEAAEAPAADTVTCEAFVDKMIEVTAVQGEDSFFQADSRGEWIAGCTAANDLGEEPNATVARCILAAADLEAVQGCGETRFVNRWMTRR